MTMNYIFATKVTPSIFSLIITLSEQIREFIHRRKVYLQQASAYKT
jgi:hypothetical protein